MIFREVLGNVQGLIVKEEALETVALEWHELDKRILRKTTDRGTEIGIALDGAGPLKRGDVLYTSPEQVIVVELLPTEAVVLEPRDMLEMAQVCYKLGNRHARVFSEANHILVPFDPTIIELFERLGIPVRVERRLLEHALPSGSHHHH